MRPSMTLSLALASAWAPAPPTSSTTGSASTAGLEPRRRAARPRRRAAAATLAQPARADDASGTAEDRRRAVAARIKELGVEPFAESWPETRPDVRRPDAPQTRLAFSDYNHCDLTCMAPAVHRTRTAPRRRVDVQARRGHPGEQPRGPRARRQLGHVHGRVRIGAAAGRRDTSSSSPESRSKVWTPGAPDSFRRFVLVDDEGVLLTGAPTGPTCPPGRAQEELRARRRVEVRARRAIFRWAPPTTRRSRPRRRARACLQARPSSESTRKARALPSPSRPRHRRRTSGRSRTSPARRRRGWARSRRPCTCRRAP